MGKKKALMAGLLRGHPQAMMRTIRAPVVPGSSLTLMSPGGTGKHPRDLHSNQEVTTSLITLE